MRSGVENTSNESYYKNYIFDNISNQFNATENEFTLKQNSSDVPGISTENAIILVNDVFQTPGLHKSIYFEMKHLESPRLHSKEQKQLLLDLMLVFPVILRVELLFLLLLLKVSDIRILFLLVELQ